MTASHRRWCGASWFDKLTMKRSLHSRLGSLFLSRRCLLTGGSFLARRSCRGLAVLHALELQAVGVEEEDGVVVVVVLAGRIDDGGLHLVLEECLQVVHVLAAA